MYKRIKYSILFLGFTAMLTQLVLIREFLAAFSGNELVIGWAMASWMLITAGGAWLTGRIRSGLGRQGLVILLQIALAILPLITFFFFNIIRSESIPFGRMANLEETFLMIFLSLLPFCLVSGALFPLLAEELSGIFSGNMIHKAYIYDSTGSVIGGLAFSIVLVSVFKTSAILGMLLFLNLLFAFVLARSSGRKYTTAFISVLISASILFFIFINPEKLLSRINYKGQKIVKVEDTPYGRMVITQLDKQLNIYQNGIPVYSGQDPVKREEMVHYAMFARPGAEKVLMISGGLSGAPLEVLKYPIKQLDYVDVDPWLTRFWTGYSKMQNNSLLKVHLTDGRLFVRNTHEKFDVILLNVGEPASAEMNRYFTKGFFREVYKTLNPGGVFSLSLLPAGNYMSDESRYIHSVTYLTVHSIFKNVRIIPGERDYILASDGALDYSLSEQARQYGDSNDYVNQYYLNDDLISMRARNIQKELDPEVRLNTDLRPSVYYGYLKFWLSRYHFNAWIIPLILLGIMLIFFLRMGPVSLGLFNVGFSASSLEFILILLFQTIFGSIYQMTGLIFAIFMAGLAVGAWIANLVVRDHLYRNYLQLLSIIMVFSILLPLFMKFMVSISLPAWFNALSIVMMILVISLLCGMQFSVATMLYPHSILRSAGTAFGADLAGSALGLLLTSTFLVPYLGLSLSAFCLGGLNLLTIFIIHLKGKNNYLYNIA